jgi:predicted NBD/HSP70 family sugar kinase
LWNWESEIDAPYEVLEAWRGFDLAAEISAHFDWPVHFCNDTTAACAAELLCGNGRVYRDYAYFYIGYFIGGGIVIGGSLYQGRGGNAGALGSFPVPGGSGGTRQLIQTASLHTLEMELTRRAIAPDMLWRGEDGWQAAEPDLTAWIEAAARGIAVAGAGAASVLDIAAIVIDGAMPADVRGRLTQAVRKALDSLDLRGLSPVSVMEGTIGASARAMGAASLALFANFIIDRDVLFKEASRC